MSQADRKLFLPIGSNCTEQSPGAAATTTGVRAWASSSAGLSVRVSMWKPGK